MTQCTGCPDSSKQIADRIEQTARTISNTLSTLDGDIIVGVILRALEINYRCSDDAGYIHVLSKLRYYLSRRINEATRLRIESGCPDKECKR